MTQQELQNQHQLQTNERISLSKVLFVKNERMELNIPAGILPDFIVKANEVVNRGHIAEATKLLNDGNIGAATRMAEADQPHANIIYLMLALIFQKTQQLKKAEKWYKKILESEENALVLNELGCIYQGTGRASDALDCRRKAVQVDPTNAWVFGNYAADLMLAGRLDEGVDLLRDALKADPDNAVIHSNLIWYLHYLPNQDSEMLLEEHTCWGRIHAPASIARTSHRNTPDPDRRLRIGYISPDFRKHSMAYNFEAFLRGRNSEFAEVYGYGNVTVPDEMTERLKGQFDHYRNVYGVDDEQVIRLIEQDQIDILVELGGHTGNNRLRVLAYKPAPVQVDYGGLNTSGMQQIDYRFTDSLLDPPERHRFYIEESICLPGGLFCYSPPDFAPDVEPLPALRNGCVTFGSFNGSLKVNPHIQSLWAQVLKANKQSRLLMKFPGGGDQHMKEMFVRRFEEFGISANRVKIVAWKPSVEHLKLYGQVDIVLDTYPFNGCITTLEGLWMGVPPISLVGKNSLLSRSGLSILSRIGLECFAAHTPDEFVAKANALSQNLPALAKIRASLRQRMNLSSLCDRKGYAQSVEDAYRKMWYRWCRSQGVDTPNCEFNFQSQNCRTIGAACLSDSADASEEL